MKVSAGHILVVAAGLTAGLTGATRVYAGDTTHKVAICHGTASEKNPYVLVIVDESAKNGHFDGTAPGHGKNNAPDFLLAENLTKEEEQELRQRGNGACDCPNSGPGS